MFQRVISFRENIRVSASGLVIRCTFNGTLNPFIFKLLCLYGLGERFFLLHVDAARRGKEGRYEPFSLLRCRESSLKKKKEKKKQKKRKKKIVYLFPSYSTLICPTLETRDLIDENAVEAGNINTFKRASSLF